MTTGTGYVTDQVLRVILDADGKIITSDDFEADADAGNLWEIACDAGIDMADLGEIDLEGATDYEAIKARLLALGWKECRCRLVPAPEEGAVAV